MKLFLLFAFPFLILSCSGSLDSEEEKEPKTTDPETSTEELEEPAEPEEKVDDGLQFVAPDTTSELMQEEDKKTVTGPAPVSVPEPEPDSAIDIAPPIPSED